MTDPIDTSPEAVARRVEKLRKRTVKTLPANWQKGLKCPDCGSDADRPKCMWDHGPSCVRHDPDAYEPPAWMEIPDPDCAESADMLEALAARVDELEAELHEMTTVKDIHAEKRLDNAERAEAAEAQLAARDAECAKLTEALIAAAVKGAVDYVTRNYWVTGTSDQEDPSTAVLAITPADAKAALDRMLQEARRDERAKALRDATMKARLAMADNPQADEYTCSVCADAIRSLIHEPPR